MALLCILYLAGFAVGQLIPSSHIAASTSNGRTLKKPRNLFRSTLQDRSKHRAKVHRDIIEGGRKPPADYGGRHPFELMAGERRRRRREQKSQQLRRTADIEGGTFNEDWFEEEWELEACRCPRTTAGLDVLRRRAVGAFAGREVPVPGAS